MHRFGIGKLEQFLQIESVAKASWFGHDPGDGNPSPCDDQSKHRLALLTPRRRAEKRPVLTAGTDPHNSAMQHYPGIGWMGQFRVFDRAPSDGGGPGIRSSCLVPYSRPQTPSAPERRPPGGMR